jgi:hypothetical protein
MGGRSQPPAVARSLARLRGSRRMQRRRRPALSTAAVVQADVPRSLIGSKQAPASVKAGPPVCPVGYLVDRRRACVWGRGGGGHGR